MKKAMINMKCNNCNTKMEDALYLPSGDFGKLKVYKKYDTIKKEYPYVGCVKYCPKCGNLQVNIKK